MNYGQARHILQNLPKDEFVLADKPWAWQVFVRRIDSGKPYVMYSTYDNIKAATATVNSIRGAPLEVKLVPLYPAISQEDLK